MSPSRLGAFWRAERGDLKISNASLRPVRARLLRAAAAAALGIAFGCGGGEDDPREEEEVLSLLEQNPLDEPISAYQKLVEGLNEQEANDGRDRLDQLAIARWVEAGTISDHLGFLFDHGDELSTTEFTTADGAGSLVTASRFARYPTRGFFTGPNASSCGSCHDQPRNNGAGRNVANVVQDPEPSVAGDFNVRNTRNVNGDPWLQLAGLEMTEDLQAARERLRESVRGSGTSQSIQLVSKGVEFGTLICSPGEQDVQCDYGQVQGVSADLVVRSQGWKGNHTTIRAFSEDAFFGEMGMHSDRFALHVRDAEAGVFQPLPDDLAASALDVDLDGVAHELSVGDITAMVIYLVGQAPPTDFLRLRRDGELELSDVDVARIDAGREQFVNVGCEDCHKLSLRVQDSVFREPDGRNAAYFDYVLFNSENGYDAAAPVRVDLADSEIVEGFLEPGAGADGGQYFDVPALTDLKRHFLGEHLCDDAKRYTPVDASHRPARSPLDSPEVIDMAIDRCEFLTADLWGVASTAPYLHDGRAGTLVDAIFAHCSEGERQGEGDASCRAFQGLAADARSDLVAFLRSQLMVGE